MGWDYCNVDVDVTARCHDWYDLPALIRADRDQYARLKLEGRYEEWERPGVFLHAVVRRDVDCGEMTVDSIDFAWTQADYRALCRVCPEADLAGTVVPREVLDRQPGPNDAPLPIEEA